MFKPKEAALRFDDRAAYRAWAEVQQRGRWERCDGVVLAMAPERARHVRVKYIVWASLRHALAEAGSPCEALGDSITVEVGEETDYEPDVLVNCGDRVADESVVASSPVVIVEVLSPSTAQRDVTRKLEDYFTVPSICHYILVSTESARVILHSRMENGLLLATPHSRGPIKLDPPGIAVDPASFYVGTDLALPG